MEGLIYGGKFAFQNRPGLYWERNLRLKINWASSWLEGNFISNLQKVFTETSLENVDLTETKPCEYFVYMELGNPSQELKSELCKQQYSLTHFDCNHLAHVIVLWQMQKFLCYCTVFALLYFEFEGNFQVQASGGLYLEGDLANEFWGLVFGGAYT